MGLPKFHELKDGTKILVTSPHLPKEGNPSSMKFSDGSEFSPTREEAEKIRGFYSSLTVIGLRGENDIVVLNKGSRTFVRPTLSISEEGLNFLRNLQNEIGEDDLILVAFPVISALKEMGLKDEFLKVVSFFATKETQRAIPREKVIDINRWSV